MKSLLLIDGTNLYHRAHHAFEGLTSKNGEPTGAIYGTMRLLEAELNKGHSHVAFAVDHKAPTFRHKAFKEYKGTRKPLDPNLKEQVPVILRMVKAMGIHIIRKKGVEADDVIGTLALKYCPKIPVTIMTGDKDFCQLVREGITVWNPQKKLLIDCDKVKEIYGVHAHQYADYLALVGDSVDNIAGVAGCGPKMAQEIFAHYDCLDKALRKGKKLKPRTFKLLTEQAEALELSRFLTRIKCDVKGLPKLDEFRPGSRTPEFWSIRTKYNIKGGKGSKSKGSKASKPAARPPSKGLFG